MTTHTLVSLFRLRVLFCYFLHSTLWIFIHYVKCSWVFHNKRIVQTSTSGIRWLRFWARPVWSLWTDSWRLWGTMWWTSHSIRVSASQSFSRTGPFLLTQNTTNWRVRILHWNPLVWLNFACINEMMCCIDFSKAEALYNLQRKSMQIKSFSALICDITATEEIRSLKPQNKSDIFWDVIQHHKGKWSFCMKTSCVTRLLP